MNCMSCNRPLTDEEIYVCSQCADEYAHLVDNVDGGEDAEVSQ
ncbi:protein NinF [Proteus mirabilis]